MVLSLRPRRLDANENIEIAPDLPGFDVDLLVDLEQDERIVEVVIGILVAVVEAVCIGIEDDAVDVLSDLGR